MQLPKNAKNPLNNIPFFSDPEDPYPFQTYMFQVFRNLAVNQASQVETMSKELLAWIMMEWFEVLDKAVKQRDHGASMCEILVPKELLEFTARLMGEMKGKKRMKTELVPECEALSNELKKYGFTPKSDVPREELNGLKDTEILNTDVPVKERRKVPKL